MTVFVAILMGLVYGLTEFLPVSSSGHLLILEKVFALNYSAEANMLFEAMLRFATVTSIFLVYSKDVKKIVGDTLSTLAGKNEEEESGRLAPSVRTALFIAIATIPMIFALFFYEKIRTYCGNILFVGFSLLATAGILHAAGKLPEGRKNDKTSRLSDVFVVGLAQMVALIPGMSRSAATVSVGLTKGFRKEYAVKFSLLLSMPVLIVSAFVSLIDAIRLGVNWSLFPLYIVGTAIAVIAGFFSIQILRRMLKSGSFYKFSYYCVLLSVLAIISSFFI